MLISSLVSALEALPAGAPQPRSALPPPGACDDFWRGWLDGLTSPSTDATRIGAEAPITPSLWGASPWEQAWFGARRTARGLVDGVVRQRGQA